MISGRNINQIKLAFVNRAVHVVSVHVHPQPSIIDAFGIFIQKCEYLGWRNPMKISGTHEPPEAHRPIRCGGIRLSGVDPTVQGDRANSPRMTSWVLADVGRTMVNAR